MKRPTQGNLQNSLNFNEFMQVKNINPRFSGTGGSKSYRDFFAYSSSVSSSLAKKKLSKKPEVKKTGIFEAAP